MGNRGFESYRAVERAGEVANGTISSRARQCLPPTATTLHAISRAFNLPFDYVARQASSQSSVSLEVTRRREADYLFNQLTNEEQETLLVQMRVLAERRAKYETSTETA